MSVFKRLLTTKKSKTKTKERHSVAEEDCEKEFELRKIKWQEEIEKMSEFLVIRSTEEQREAGIDEPVDSAFIVDRDGLPILKALFDVHSFRPDDVKISVEDDLLTVKAEGIEDTEYSVFRKTLIRRLDLPENADLRRMHSIYTGDGLLSIEMPFHLSPQRKIQTRPGSQSNLVPILQDHLGRRSIRLAVPVGPEFTADDVHVEVRGRIITVSAAYKAEVGAYGSEIAKREIRKDFLLPDHVDIQEETHELASDGCLKLEVILKMEAMFHCEVSAEDITGSSGSLNESE